MATIITKTVFASGGFYNSDNKLVFIKESTIRMRLIIRLRGPRLNPMITKS